MAEHSELPLRDYDHLPLAALGHRIRSFREGELRQLLDYERQHANRPAAVQVFTQRLAELAAGAQPSPGRAQDGPEWPPPPAGDSAAGPQTTGPSSGPPPHGTPDQPARPKGDRRAP